MARLRLRSQLLIATLLIICGLLGALLLIVRHTVRAEIAEGVRQSTEASLRAFENVQKERELQLSRTTAMLAELPTLKAVMATQHALTIQDASEPFWKLAGSQLFMLAGPDGRVFAFHLSRPGWHAQVAEADLKKSLEAGDDAAWWYGNGQLYDVSLRAILSGSDADLRQLGIIAVGYEIDSSVATQLSLASGSQIALTTGGRIIASTLSPEDEAELQKDIAQSGEQALDSRQITLGRAAYRAATVLLNKGLNKGLDKGLERRQNGGMSRGEPASVTCYVLMSLEPANAFLQRLNRTILILGVSAILLAGVLLSFVSRTISHPLDDLVAGVRALAQGDYTYSVHPRGSSEVAELGEAFSKMRGELLSSERRRFEIERIAAFGRAASSISHDLRHYLAAVVANAEFLHEADRLHLDRHEIYGEIKLASEQMTDLLDALRELSREQAAIAPRPADLTQTIRRAVDAVRARPEMRARSIIVRTRGDMAGVFDPQKIERAFINLVLNACEASTQAEGDVEIDIAALPELFQIRVTDHGTGVPAAIRSTLFEPFVSYGKSTGTGLGLAIVNKVIQDHGGSAVLEDTSGAGTTFLVTLPRAARPVSEPTEAVNQSR